MDNRIFFLSHNFRKKELGGGTVLDLGVYVIQLSQWVFQQAPKSIEATGTLNANGVDVDMQAEIKYGADEVAHVSTSALKKLSNTATIRGTKGEVTVNTNFSEKIDLISIYIWQIVINVKL